MPGIGTGMYSDGYDLAILRWDPATNNGWSLDPDDYNKNIAVRITVLRGSVSFYVSSDFSGTLAILNETELKTGVHSIVFNMGTKFYMWFVKKDLGLAI